MRLRAISRRALLLFLLLTSIAAFAADHKSSEIVFMTDFGSNNDAVPICKGVMLSITPEARIIDLTHDVTPFSILDGARFLAGTTPYYPEGTVFVVVIDPTVGSSRKAIVAKSKKNQYFILPDNGLLTFLQDRDGIEGVHEITNKDFMIGAGISSTFHGRDIFSPAGAHVARGDDWTKAGPEVPVAQLVRLNVPKPTVDNGKLSATIFGIDVPFGNLITNVNRDDFAKLGYQFGDRIPVTLGANEMEIPLVHTFSDVDLGKPLLFIDSRGRLSFALNQNDFAKTYNIKPPVSFTIPAKK
jgi:S-adenosyl-L-methionine hydrolase (adenosine-forming)